MLGTTSKSNSHIPFVSTTIDFMNALPNEILEKILEYLKASDLARLESVCQSWKQKAGDLEAWKILVRRDFSEAYRAILSLNQTQSFVAWSQVYRTYMPWREKHCLKKHVQEVSCIAVLSDDRLVTGSTNGTVYIWSLEGENLYELHGHKRSISCIIVLPDGRIATASHDHTVSIWSSEGQQLYMFCGHVRPIQYITTLPEGRLATASSDDTIRIWSLNGKVLHQLYEHTCSVTCIILLPDGRFATGSKDCTVRIWAQDPKSL